MGNPTKRRAAILLVFLVGSCTSSGGGRAPTEPVASLPLTHCTERGDLLCGSVEVPLDRANPAAGRIPVEFYVHRRTDTASPPGEPIFALPGGPGSGGIDVMEFVLAIDTVVEHHDVVAIDPRGTGRSGAIECPDLQNGWSGLGEMNAAVGECGAHLGDAADRYGSGDVALDVEAVRRALGYDRVDLYAYSYGSVPEQAYATRFPGHVHALVVDAGLSVTDAAHTWAWRLGVPAALVRAIALMCSRQTECSGGDAAGAIRWLVRRVAAAPVRGEVDLPFGDPLRVVVDQAAVATVLQATGTCALCGQTAPADVVDAATSLRAGNPRPLLRLAAVHSRGPLARPPDATAFSTGDNIAAFCNDQDFVWERTDPVGVRSRKLRAAVAAFPPDAFAPFTVAGWTAFASPAGCLAWPAPDRFEPAVPPGAAVPDVPTLILAGDSDTVVPPEVVATLRHEFPDADFVTVAGAGHPVAGVAWGHCAAELIGRLFDTLAVGDTSCAAHAS